MRWEDEGEGTAALRKLAKDPFMNESLLSGNFLMVYFVTQATLSCHEWLSCTDGEYNNLAVITFIFQFSPGDETKAVLAPQINFHITFVIVTDIVIMFVSFAPVNPPCHAQMHPIHVDIGI